MTGAEAARAGLRIAVHGAVQGVGFRPWVYRLARDAGLTGRVRNDAEGVTIEAFGPSAELSRFLHQLERSPPPAATIERVESEAIPIESAREFVIEPSRVAAERRVSIPSDLALCDACSAEICDPANRRYQYAFTNCTDCGPRFTIARDVPYDRAATAMASFTMCRECQAEYDDVRDRRFHAQPNACPRCGPHLALVAGDGSELPCANPLASAAEALIGGEIVAVKGLGGFHLACDATSSLAVGRLRARKRREEKPFAVMVADLAMAERLAELQGVDRCVLVSVERPVVLLRARGDSMLAPEVAPSNPLVGLMLPYTPLHQLLMAAVARPLVMTSGNLSEEPLAYRNEDAARRLGGIASRLLIHDRDIETPCDDSVVQVIAGRTTVLRRARGYVPRPVCTQRRFSPIVLACGAQLKNTFCFGTHAGAFFGPHVGDLENEAACAHFEASVLRMQRFLCVEPEIIAHDLHPDYFSTRYALMRPEPVKIAVQHHHAHVASAMAEHDLAGPVFGLAYDGTGFGTDGTSWGGELLLADCVGFTRVATFRPLPLAGGDTAVREVWRLALAAVDDAFAGDGPIAELDLFRQLPQAHVDVVRQMIERRVNVPLARGVGRYFDAVGALGLTRPRARYEGQVALEWNLAADPGELRRYPFDVDELELEHLLTIDLRPAVRAIVHDLLDAAPVSAVSARFHNTLVAATAFVVREAARRFGRLPLVLSGGCFQNALLAGGIERELREFDVRRHGAVPPGDGGIALGQAVVAEALARKSL